VTSIWYEINAQRIIVLSKVSLILLKIDVETTHLSKSTTCWSRWMN